MPRRPLAPTHDLRRTAQRLAVPLAATPGSFFLQPQDAAVHRLLRAIDRNTALSRLTADDVAPADAWLARTTRPLTASRHFISLAVNVSPSAKSRFADFAPSLMVSAERPIWATASRQCADELSICRLPSD